jgi:hypothetical protein
MPRTNISNSTKFGKRKITSFTASSFVKLQSIEVSSINGVSVEQNTIIQNKQTEDIESLKLRVQKLENIIRILTNITI